MNYYTIFIQIIFCAIIQQISANIYSKNAVIEDVTDAKQLKKIFRTKTNVLVLFISNQKENQQTVKTFRDAAELVKGQGTMILIDCSANSDTKKMCKKLKITPQPFIMKHYKDSEYNKDYDRQIAVTSILNFMKDPTGDLPWEEDPNGADVLHIKDAKILEKFLKKESKPVMVMFYAPWCGFCKQMKPDYSAAATDLKPKYILAAIDANRPENSIIKKQYNISGFPTLLYYEHGELKYTYEGENTKDGITAFMRNPTAPPLIKAKDADWAAETNSEIVHLTSSSFEPALKDENSVLVMFYAPWCGHCKRMKPEYEKAAQIMKDSNINGVLAALDATKEGSIAGQYDVKGYPTVKYFVNGEFKFDVNVRDSEKIVEFMKNPIEPPPPPPPEKEWEDDTSSLVVHLNDETFKPFLKKKKHVLVMFYAPWCGHCKKAKPEFNTAAEHFKDDPHVELAAVDCTKKSALCGVFNVKGFPTLKYFNFLKTVREYNGGRTSNDFIKFLSNPDAPEEKKIPQPFGTYPGSDHVLILSDENFESTLKTKDKALVMFYAPWCGHCTNMKPAFSEAAERLINLKAGVIAAVDATINTAVSEKYAIKGFPTLKYFEFGVLKSDYTGKRTTNDLFTFVQNAGSQMTKDEL